jgi:hypothetical protein
MLAWNLVHMGLLGKITHAEGGYIHNLTERSLADHFRNRHKKASLYFSEYGNTYPTHPLGPICFYMDMNRGDKMDYLVSVSSCEAGWSEYIKETFGPEDWQSKLKFDKCDMNTTIIKTALGRTIMLQLDKATPRPYSRLGFLSGTKGAVAGWPMRIALEKQAGKGAHRGLSGDSKTEKEREEFKALGADVTVATADGSYGVKGFVTDALPSDYTYFYTCGPEPMLKAVFAASATEGQFSFEERMGCGFGACMGCSCKTVTGYKRICKEGPVLRKEEILWER